MASILLGWENGEGLGHVEPMLKVAHALAAEGHQSRLALSNLIDTWSAVKQAPFPLLQSPVWTRRPFGGAKPFLASGYADVLAVRGWDDPDTLMPMVRAWESILDLARPDVVMCEYAPVLALAAYGRIPTIHFGSWFSLPPSELPCFPALLPQQSPVLAQDKILQIVQEVQRRRNRPAPQTLTSLLFSENCFPLVLPELDGYRNQRMRPTFDPLDALPPPLAPVQGGSFFAYLSGDNPNVEAVLTKLALTGRPGTVYLRGGAPELKERLRLQGLKVLAGPAPLMEMLGQSAVIVHHGGMGTSNTALAAGRPQLIVPQHLEQTVNAQNLYRLGVALALTGNSTPDTAGRHLQQLLSESRFAENAQALAQNIHTRPRRPALPAILGRCRGLLMANHSVVETSTNPT